jgi:hypothetical protein
VVLPQTLNWECGRQAANAATTGGWSFERSTFSCRSASVAALEAGTGLVSVAPSNFRAIVTGATVQLDWDRVIDPVISHQIEAGSAPGLANLAVFNTGSAANTLTVGNVPPGEYYVRVRAVGPDNQPGPASNEIVVRVGSCLGAPGAPGALIAEVSGNRVTLSWPGTNVPAASSYIVEAGTAPGLANIVVFDTGNAAQTVSATAPDGLYYVRVRGRNACGTGPASNEVRVSVPGGAPPSAQDPPWTPPPLPDPPGPPPPVTSLVPELITSVPVVEPPRAVPGPPPRPDAAIGPPVDVSLLPAPTPTTRRVRVRTSSPIDTLVFAAETRIAAQSSGSSPMAVAESYYLIRLLSPQTSLELTLTVAQSFTAQVAARLGAGPLGAYTAISLVGFPSGSYVAPDGTRIDIAAAGPGVTYRHNHARTWTVYEGQARYTDGQGRALPGEPGVTLPPTAQGEFFIGYTVSPAELRTHPTTGEISTVRHHEFGHVYQMASGRPAPTNQVERDAWEAEAHHFGAAITARFGATFTDIQAALDYIRVNVARYDPTFVQLSSSPADGPSRRLDNDLALHAEIQFPPDGALVKAEVPIFGIASGSRFQSYVVEYGAGVSPTEWKVLTRGTQQEVTPRGLSDMYSLADVGVHGNLATWDTGLKDYVYLPTYPPDHPIDVKGTYTVRLRVIGTDGSTAEDRVTVFAAHVISNAWGGSVTSADGGIRLLVPEHTLKQPFRLLGFEAAQESVPESPLNRRPVGRVYRAYEAGETFTSDATITITLEQSLSDAAAAHRIAIHGYAPEVQQWVELPTTASETPNGFSATVRRLHQFYRLMEHSDGTPALVLRRSRPSPGSLEGQDDSSLSNQSFERDTGTWHSRFDDGTEVDRETSPAGSSSLKVTNVNSYGSFGVTAFDTSFDVTVYPIIQFDYRTTAEVKTDIYVKAGGRWYSIGFTDDANDFAYKRVNISSIGRLEGIQQDGAWHTARFNLWDMLRTRTREHIVDEIVLADWDVPGTMRLIPGHNRSGASYWIDNFVIGRDGLAGRRPVSDTFVVDDFSESLGRNRIGGVTDLFTGGHSGTIDWAIVHDESLGRVLALHYRLGADSHAGYISNLPSLDLRDYQFLRFKTRSSPALRKARIGVRDGAGHESKLSVAEFLPAKGMTEIDVAIPVAGFDRSLDWSTIINVSVSFEAASPDEGHIVIGDLRFERALQSALVESFESLKDRNVLGGSRATFTAGATAATGAVVSDGENTFLRIAFGGEIGKLNAYASEVFSYAGWRTDLRSLDCSRCQTIRFRIRGARGGETPNVYLDDGAHRWCVPLREFVEVTTDWQDVAIPVAHFAKFGVDLTHLSALEFVFEWTPMSGAIYIDEIGFRP